MSVTSLPMLNKDKTSFRHWNDRMMNVVINARPGTRTIFQYMMVYVDKDTDGEFEE